MRTSISDYIQNQDAKLKELEPRLLDLISDCLIEHDTKLKKLESELANLRELQGTSVPLENEYQMCDFKIPIFIEDEYDRKIFTTPLYSFAKEVAIKEDSRKWGLEAINYYFDIELKNGRQRVYCREEGWQDLNMRVVIARARETEESHGHIYLWDHVKHGPSIEDLKNFYTNKGVNKNLIEKMAELVNNIRVKCPAGSTLTG